MCRSVTLPTCGAHRPVPTNGCRSYIRFLTRDSGSFRSSQSLTEDDLWILDFWQTGYKSLHYSNVPSQRSEHHLRTQIPLPGCLKFKNTSQTNRVTPNNVPFHPVLTDVFFITPLQLRSAGREEESLIAETRYTRRHGFISPHLRTRLWLGIPSPLRVPCGFHLSHTATATLSLSVPHTITKVNCITTCQGYRTFIIPFFVRGYDDITTSSYPSLNGINHASISMQRHT